MPVDLNVALANLIAALPADQKTALLKALSPAEAPSTPRRKSETPLAVFWRQLSKDDKEAFAAACETTLLYLQQLASKRDPNPTLRLAHAVVMESRRIAPRLGVQPLDYPDLLVGNPDGRSNTKPRAPREHKRSSAAGGSGAAGAG